MVQGLYALLGRQCPLEPQMYRQKTVCEAEGVPFRSKAAIMRELILNFTPARKKRCPCWPASHLETTLSDTCLAAWQDVDGNSG